MTRRTARIAMLVEFDDAFVTANDLVGRFGCIDHRATIIGKPELVVDSVPRHSISYEVFEQILDKMWRGAGGRGDEALAHALRTMDPAAIEQLVQTFWNHLLVFAPAEYLANFPQPKET